LGQSEPRRSKVQAVQHYAALPYSEVAALIEKLRAKRNSLAAVALDNPGSGPQRQSAWSSLGRNRPRHPYLGHRPEERDRGQRRARRVRLFNGVRDLKRCWPAQKRPAALLLSRMPSYARRWSHETGVPASG
jgi:hypothetical protein